VPPRRRLPATAWHRIRHGQASDRRSPPRRHGGRSEAAGCSGPSATGGGQAITSRRTMSGCRCGASEVARASACPPGLVGSPIRHQMAWYGSSGRKARARSADRVLKWATAWRRACHRSRARPPAGETPGPRVRTTRARRPSRARGEDDRCTRCRSRGARGWARTAASAAPARGHHAAWLPPRPPRARRCRPARYRSQPAGADLAPLCSPSGPGLGSPTRPGA
jgi:hypothetical protein